MIISRITDAFLAMPFLITAIALAAFLGPSLTNAMIAIGLSAMPIFIRLTRGQVLSVKTEDYVEGARSIGLRHSSIITRYILPNVLAPILVQATLDGRHRDHRRGQPLLPRPWPAAAGAELGIDAERRQEFPLAGAMDGGLAGRCDLPRRHRLQSVGRRAARCARPT